MLGSKPLHDLHHPHRRGNSTTTPASTLSRAKFGTAVAPIVAPIIDGSKKVTGIVDLLHNKAYEVKGGKAAGVPIPADIADEVRPCVPS